MNFIIYIYVYIYVYVDEVMYYMINLIQIEQKIIVRLIETYANKCKLFQFRYILYLISFNSH